MSQYQFEKKLPSIFFDKDLLKQLEKYLSERIPDKFNSKVKSSDREINFDYNFSINDKYGSEQFETIESFHRDKFSNDTKGVQIKLSTNYRLIDIRLTLSKDGYSNKIEISVYSDDAKEIAHGIKNEIEELVMENKTIHSIFYGNSALIVFTVFISMGIISLIATLVDSKALFLINYLNNTVYLIAATFYSIRFISPYITFDTKKEEKKQRFTSWLLNGLAGVFVFGVLALYLRRIII